MTKDPLAVRRSYEFWHHASDLVAGSSPTELQLVDVIASLKRAVSNRVATLNGTYSLAKIPLRDNPSDSFQRLAQLGVIRPMMLRLLIDIRNAIEHENKAPPTSDKCREFLEFVWYFLRSTDLLVRDVITDFRLVVPGDVQTDVIEVSMEPPDWNIDMRGFVEPALVTADERHGWMMLIPLRVANMDIEVDTVSDAGTTLKLGPEGDVRFFGRVKGRGADIEALLIRYFERA